MPRRKRPHPVFEDDAAARKALENLRWPEGPRCVSCASPNVETVGGEKHSHRDGLFRCKDCRKQFTVTVNTVFHRSKVPLSKWMQVIYLENAGARNSWQIAQATGLSHKTVDKMRARIHAAVGRYKGPNVVFGNPVRSYVQQQRPRGYQRPPKAPKASRADDGVAMFRWLRRWYAWRAKHPLADKIEQRGVLAKLDAKGSQAKLASTESLLLQLLSERPIELAKRRRKLKTTRHLGWIKNQKNTRRRTLRAWVEQ